MKKLMIALLLMLLCISAAAAEAAEPAVTPAPTPVPDLIAQPDATRRPIQTATPRPADAPLPEDLFLGHAVEIARRVDQLAESSVFYTYCNRSQTSREIWDQVSRGDHTTPARIFSLSGDALVTAFTGGDPASAPWFDMNRPELRRDMVETLPDMMLYGADQDLYQTIMLLARYKVFASDMEDGCGLLIMLYEDGTPVVLPWYADRGAVSICAYFMPDALLEGCRTAEDVSAWFAGLGMPEVTFEEVAW